MNYPAPLTRPARVASMILLAAGLLAPGAAALVFGGCHLIFPFQVEAPLPDADLPADAAVDVGPADTIADQLQQEAGVDGPAQDLPKKDLPALDLPADLGSDQLAPPCPCSAADLNKSGTVDNADLAIFSPCYSQPPTGSCKVADTDSDGSIDGSDLKCLAAWMNKTC
jgi:hypothetical protein